MATKERVKISERILKLKERLELSYRDLEDKTGISKATIQRIAENPEVKISIDNLEALAKAFNVDPAWLIGWKETGSNVSEVINKMTSIPILEYVSCGKGIYNDGQTIDYISIPSELLNPRKEYFAQYAKGDSMVGVGITDGDVLVFERTDVPEENRIGTFCIDNEYAICKRFKYKDGKIYLLSANDDYLPIVVDPETCECFRTVGLLAFVLNDMKEK